MNLTREERNEIHTLLLYATMHPRAEFQFHQEHNAGFVDDWYRKCAKWLDIFEKTKDLD